MMKTMKVIENESEKERWIVLNHFAFMNRELKIFIRIDQKS